MKRRIGVAVSVFVVFALLVFPQMALDCHLFLSKAGGLTWKPWEAWPELLRGGKPLQFYLAILGCWALLLLSAIVSSSYIKYRSDMIQVTPAIQTPAPAGQGQYGTARWAGEKEPRRVYSAAEAGGAKLKELLDAGRRDYREVENAHVKID